jgi:hypothetical protein
MPGKRWSTEGDLASLKAPKKRVEFNDLVRVVLIPSKGDFVEAGVSSSLWWTRDDYLSFRTSARREMDFILRTMDTIDLNSALRILYQP